MTATISTETTKPVTIGAIHANPYLRNRTRYMRTTKKLPDTVNSYMLPHGTRLGSAARPRPTSDTKCPPHAMTVRITPRRPRKSTRWLRAASTSGSVSREAPPVATATPPPPDAMLSLATLGARSEAHSPRCTIRARK